MISAFRLTLFALAGLCGLISLLILASVNQVNKNEMLLTDVRSIVAAIYAFKQTNDRLPTVSELSTLEDSVPRRYPLKYNFKFGVPPSQPGENYPTQLKAGEWIIWYWRGEWSEYYSSWDNHYSLEEQTDLWNFCKPILWAPFATIALIGLGIYPWKRKPAKQ